MKAGLQEWGETGRCREGLDPDAGVSRAVAI